MALSKDLTVGSIPRHVVWFSLPVLLSNFLQALYNVVDSWFVGRYVGSAGLSAVSVSFPIMLVMISFVFGLGMGSTILIGQYMGRGDRENLQKTADTAIIGVFVFGVAISILGILLARPLLQLIHTPAESLEYAVQYLQIIFIGMVFVFGYNMLSGFQRGLGDSVTPLYFVAISTFVNIVLDYLFIAKFHMGVAGAAWATIIAQTLSFLLGVLYFKLKKHVIDFNLRRMRYYRDKMRAILKIGLPTSIQQTLLSISFAVFNTLINDYGVAASAAAGVGGRVDSFAVLPAQSIMMSVSSISAQNIGAGKHKRAFSAALHGTAISFGICALAAVGAILFAPQIISFFNDEPDVIRLGTQYLRTVSICYVFFGVMFSFMGLIQGAGNTMFAMVVSIVTQYVIRLPLAFLLSRTFHMGFSGVLTAIIFGPIIGMIATVGYAISGKWKKAQVLNPLPSEEAVEPAAAE